MAETSNQCSVCGKPATSAVLKDPFGKSDVWEPRCGDHGMRLYGAAMNTSIVTRLQKLQSEGFELSELEKLVAAQGETIERLTAERDNARLAAEQNKGIAEELRAALLRIREFILEANRGTTHWAGCEVGQHDLCAIDRVARGALSGASHADETEPESDKAKVALACLYQVLGALAGIAGHFETEDVQDALDVASRWESMSVEFIEALLPWPRKELAEKASDDVPR